MQTKEPDRQGQTNISETKKIGLFHCLQEWSELIKIEHTVFALPFALSGLMLGANKIPAPAVWFWTILSFASARAAAMTLNRVIDAKTDAANPRTKSRAIPDGRIKSSQALVLALSAFSLMIFAALHLPPLCLWLSPIAVIWLSFYSFTKRFTWLCHLALGIALGGAALGGWIAAGGQLTGLAPFVLALAVTTWVAGFDIIYALQDFDFDLREHLHSIPARFGIEKALVFSKALHLSTVSLLIVLGSLANLGAAYWLGVSLVAIMLKWEHSLIKPHDLSRVDAAFFKINGLVSIAAFIAIFVDRWLAF